MIPQVDNAHVQEALGFLTSMFRNKANVTALLSAFVTRYQAIENAYWSIISGVQLANHPMPGGPWDILDKLGAIVGVPRNGLDDTSYVNAIRIKTRINVSNGHPDDLLNIALLVTSPISLREWPNAAYEIDALATTSAAVQALLTDLQATSPAGVMRQLRYSLGSAPLWVLGDSQGSVVGATGLKDSVSGRFPNTLTSLEDL